MSESRGNEGLGTGLSKLPKFDKSSFMASYVKQQQRNTNVYEVEGKRYLQTWGREERKVGSSAVGSGVSEALGRDARRKAKGSEKEKGKGRAWIETPVLKPRNPELRGRDEVAEKARSRASGKENAPPKEARKAVGTSKAEKGKEAKKKASTSKETGMMDDESESGEDTETRAREQRMNARRERRREKREIVNPKKRKGSPERDSDHESDEGGKASKKKGAKPKKQKTPAGLALMHGFSATNVGKSRLTMEHTRPAGVFSKGKASAKTSTVRKAPGGTGFSELAFLNKRQVRERRDSPEPRPSKTRNKERAPTKHPEKKTTSKTRKRAKEPTPEPSEREETASSSSSESEEEEEVRERPKRHPRSSSVTWDIERDSGRLASTDLSVEIPLVKPTKSKQPRGATVDEGEASKPGDAEKAWSSLGPHDSASQCVPSPSSPPRRRPETNTFSKYFQQILDQESAEQPSGKRVTESIPCPTFIARVPVEPLAKAPSPPPADEKEPTVVSSHREGSGLSLWQTFHPNPPRNDVPLDDPTLDSVPEDAMDYEPWQEPPMSFQNSHGNAFGLNGRYASDNRHRGDPGSIESIALFEEEGVFDYEGPLDYWDDIDQRLDGFTEQQYDLGTNGNGLVSGDMLFDDYDEASFVGDNQDLDMSLSAYDNGVFEEFYADDVANGILEEHYDDPEPVLMQWDQLELGGSQHEEIWQRMDEQDMEPDPLPPDDEHESMVDLSELGVSDSNNSTLQGLLSDGVNVCQFLRGRSALLGFDVDMGVAMPRPLSVHEERRGASRVEIDVAKTLKNHWRPQRL